MCIYSRWHTEPYSGGYDGGGYYGGGGGGYSKPDGWVQDGSGYKYVDDKTVGVNNIEFIDPETGQTMHGDENGNLVEVPQELMDAMVSGTRHKDGATVYVESDGLGHAYLETKGTVFSYGRYDGSYSPSSGTFGPVGHGVLLKKPHSFAIDRMSKFPTMVYEFPNANANAIYNYMDNIYNSGTPNLNPKGGMIVNTYFLFGNNCTTTTTCNALRFGGVDIPIIQTPFGFNMHMRFPNQFGSGYPPR